MSSALGLSESATRQVITAAGMAPSLFNTQPWLYRLRPDRIELHADLGRRLLGYDPQDRELRIACGAALFNVRLALQAHGVTPVVSVQPDHVPGALAVVRAGPPAVQSRDDAELHRAIPRRRTNRHRFLDAPPIPQVYRRFLSHAAASEGADLRSITTVERSELWRIIAVADQQQRDNVVCRAERAAWTGYRHGHRDGVPLAAAGPAREIEDPLAFRDLGDRYIRIRPPSAEPRTDPHIVVLSTRNDGADCQVQAGQALQRVLLTGTALGLTATFLSQPIEVTDKRHELRRFLADGQYPQAILRVGVASPNPATPRRNPADLLLNDQSAAGY